MTAMFANTRSSQQSSGYLVEFKAGKSALSAGSTPDKRKVVADKTKGQVFIKQSNDQLMHFCWKNRETGAVVDDLIIFPGDTEFLRVKECPDGRVFVLKFKNSDRRCFFWLQEGKTDKDDEYCRKVNDLLNNPPTRSVGRGGGDRADQLAGLGLGGAEDLGALGNLDQGQLMQLLSLMGQGGGGLDPATASALLPQLGLGGGSDGGISSTPLTTNVTPATAATSTPPTGRTGRGRTQQGQTTAPIQLSELQNIISSISVPQGQGPAGREISLESVMTGENLQEAVRSEGNEARLLPLLPTEAPVEQNREELQQTIRAPQFRQATEIFGHALQTGQLGPVLQQFGVNPEAVEAASRGDMEKFAEKLTEAEGGPKAADEKNPSGSGSSESGQGDSSEDATVREPEPKRGKTDDEMDLD
uniref:Proteasomal ubiquitin receptor ADRM1 homolog n=1 Tax=Plectus sambesii TaxID=2011161 RepID=A0A914WP82_9BILA